MSRRFIKICFLALFFATIAASYILWGVAGAIGIFLASGLFLEKFEKLFIFRVQKYIYESRKNKGGGIELSSLQNETDAQINLRNFSAAQKLAEKAIAVAEEKAGKNHLDMASALITMGKVNYAIGRYSAAEENARHALRIAENSLGPDHPELEKYLISLSNTFIAQHQYSASLNVLQRLVEISWEDRGPPLVRAHMAMARNQTYSGNPTQAEYYYNSAIQLIEQLPASTELDFKSIKTDALSSLLKIYVDSGRQSDAEKIRARMK